MATLKIDLYSEVTCPWCIIGMHRLDKVLAERFPALAVEIVHHPVLLMPDCPPDGLKIADLMFSRYGVTDPSAAWERPHAEARACGLDLDLSRQPCSFQTLSAHTLIRLARARGAAHGLAVALLRAYFLEIRNIGDPDVLADIAARHGFAREEARRLAQDPAELAETRREAARSQADGVTSVPHLIFDGRLALNGSCSEDELARTIAAAAAAIA